VQFHGGYGYSARDTVNLLPEDTVHDFPAGGWRVRELAQGIHYTIVNGQVLLEDGRYTGSARPYRACPSGSRMTTTRRSALGMEPDAVKHMPEWEEISAVAMAVHNMHLIACSLGLGCKWSSGAISRHPHVAQFLGLQLPAQLLGFLYVGTLATAWPSGQRRPMADKVTWVKE
jgi:nitroreductase